MVVVLAGVVAGGGMGDVRLAVGTASSAPGLVHCDTDGVCVTTARWNVIQRDKAI
jgi:hypothetical protein